MSGHFHIGIQQHIVFGIHLLKCLIVTIGKTKICMIHYLLDTRIMGMEERHRIICGPIVCHHDLHAGIA